MLNFCYFIQVFVFTANHHLKKGYKTVQYIMFEQPLRSKVIYWYFRAKALHGPVLCCKTSHSTHGDMKTEKHEQTLFAHFAVSFKMCLTQSCLTTHKWDIGKQCTSKSDATNVTFYHGLQC